MEYASRSPINISQNHGGGKNLKRLSRLFPGFLTSQPFQTDESFPSEGKKDGVVSLILPRPHRLVIGRTVLLPFYLNYSIHGYSCVFTSDI